MLRIKAEKLSTGGWIIDMKGQWVTEPVLQAMREVDSIKDRIFETQFNVSIHERGTTNNEVYVLFPEGATEFAVDRVVDYINVVLVTRIGTCFTEIRVNPYKVGYSDDEGGLTILMEIAKDTDCRADYGSWNTCVTFHPSNNIQHNRVTALVAEFGMTCN